LKLSTNWEKLRMAMVPKLSFKGSFTAGQCQAALIARSSAGGIELAARCSKPHLTFSYEQHRCCLFSYKAATPPLHCIVHPATL
jgi:hypothetical protein